MEEMTQIEKLCELRDMNLTKMVDLTDKILEFAQDDEAKIALLGLLSEYEVRAVKNDTLRQEIKRELYTKTQSIVKKTLQILHRR